MRWTLDISGYIYIFSFESSTCTNGHYYYCHFHGCYLQ